MNALYSNRNVIKDTLMRGSGIFFVGFGVWILTTIPLSMAAWNGEIFLFSYFKGMFFSLFAIMGFGIILDSENVIYFSFKLVVFQFILLLVAAGTVALR